ncbi:MAG TPA: peptide-methionine (S)-S-oxide reductase MsrA [Aliidongia sp.]|uniref:peptide-methionine (S)-S-oxide reductase MsrA n=1 Tax=Aliidongia sp. TaxID=1914230 RepID=UPI002DDD3253|nr:peptide-methionine (S)-S-oxide reductase MsrA [Aliidongia sp.]HEV2676116.1 peptide-methionine (S)-S-oxide reductase MsrA [Aliidongia sp.]
MKPSSQPSKLAALGKGVGALAVLGLGAVFLQAPSGRAESPVLVQPPAVDETAPATASAETAVFAGGCFWGVQGVFQHVAGVTKAVSGYSGGAKETAQYERVGTGRTGHAESVEITYDPHQITYGKLLQIFFSVAHDPTELDRQGPDSGTQYRSAIFVQSAEQKRVAQAYVSQLDKSGSFPGPIVTKLEPFKGFYPAEAYHQDFLTRNPAYPYIAINDLPKVRGLERMFPALYRDKPVLVNMATN